MVNVRGMKWKSLQHFPPFWLHVRLNLIKILFQKLFINEIYVTIYYKSTHKL